MRELQASGIALTGAVIVRLVFRNSWSFVRNALVALGPLVIAVVVVSLLSAETTGMYAHLVLRASIDVSALAGWRWLVAGRRRKT